MSSDKHWVLAGISPGTGRALDLGGGPGELHDPLTRLGYEYVNVDVEPSGPGAVVGDAHALPFEDESFELVVSSDSLEHFHTPQRALEEARRVLKPGGTLAVWVPFLHPFHTSDYYRYTPLGLRHLLDGAGLECKSIEAPLGPLTIVTQMLVVGLAKLGLARLGALVRRAATRLDALGPSWMGYAAFYRVMATKP
jgi:SAM-dependent methyltransferase